MAGRRGCRLNRIVLLALLLWGLAMGVLALVALLGEGVPFVDKEACRDAGECPAEEFEGWIVAGMYVCGALGLGYIVASTHDEYVHDRSYVRAAGVLLALSVLFAWETPRMWQPVRASFALGAVGLAACFAVRWLLGDALRREVTHADADAGGGLEP